MDRYQRDLTRELRSLGLTVSTRAPTDRPERGVVALLTVTPRQVAQSMLATAQSESVTTVYDLWCQATESESGEEGVLVHCRI